MGYFRDKFFFQVLESENGVLKFKSKGSSTLKIGVKIQKLTQKDLMGSKGLNENYVNSKRLIDTN